MFAAYSYITLHHRVFRNGVEGVDRIGEIAGERIQAQLDAMQIDQHSPEETGKALGIYIARLELCCAEYEKRVDALNVLLAGKGHEKTQTLRSGTVPFDDVAVAIDALRELQRTGTGA